MTNTMKTIIFIVSLFVFIFFFIFISFIMSPGALVNSPYAALTAGILYMSGYIIALYSQALIKYLYVRNRLKTANIIKTFPVSSFSVRDRLIIMILPLLAVILPIVQKRAFTAESLKALIYVVVLALIIELLYYLNKRTLKAYVTDKGIAVNGIDFRLELSIPFSYSDAAGFYPYERIENYLALNDQIIIYQTYDFGTITIKCSGEDVRQIKGLLVSKKIPERSY
ncbi:MAG: hypothetical protein ACM3TR_05045 [Caulobacteraceae bacterium]